MITHQDIIECGWKGPTLYRDVMIYHNGINLLIFSPDTFHIAITDRIGGLKNIGETVALHNIYSGFPDKEELKNIMITPKADNT